MVPMQSYEERRQHRRVPDSFLVAYRLLSTRAAAVRLDNNERDAIALDLSEGGLGLDAVDEIPVGAEITLRFKILNELSSTERDKRREFTLKAESRYCRLTQQNNYRVGLLFKDISEQDREFIATYVKDQQLSMWLNVNKES